MREGGNRLSIIDAYTEDVKLSLAPLLLLLTACRSSPPAPPAAPPLDPLVEEFVFGSLALSPVAATQAGYHLHKGANLDEALDDFSAQGIANQRQFYLDFRGRLDKLDRARLSAEDGADLQIMSDQIAQNLLELDRIQNYRHNPTVYVELVGNALFNPLVLEYAPKPQRIRHIIARLGSVPALLDQARRNLTEAPEIWTTVAIDENQGNIDLIDKEIRAAVPDELSADYETAAKPALDALRAFRTISRRIWSSIPCRLAARPGQVRAKFRYVLETDRKPDEVLAEAEADLKTVHARMQELACRCIPSSIRKPTRPNRPDHRRNAGPHCRAALHAGDLHCRRQAPIWTRPATSCARRDLLKLPPRDNLQVIETPVFMRGIYAVGGFNAAPALEPQLGAFYWVTPIPQDLAARARRIEAARVQLLQAASCSRFMRPCPATTCRWSTPTTCEPQVAPPAALRIRQRPVHRRLGRNTPADDARRRLSRQLARAAARRS